jgi:hypothetical protein
MGAVRVSNVRWMKWAGRSTRHRFALPAVLGVIALIAQPATGARADTPQLNAKFNANLTFSMSTQDGAPLGSPSPPGRTIPAGYYAVNVDDTAEIGYMTFLLQGPGVSLRTTNDEGASASLTYYVTLQPGSTYSFGDAVNPNLPLEYFSTSGAVGSTQGSATTSSPSGGQTQSNTDSPVGKTAAKTKTVTGASTTSSVFRGDLQATVSKTGHVTFKLNGKPVTSLTYGRYKVTVADGSPKNGFIVQEAGLDPVTVSGVSYVGKRSATVQFSVGQWLYYPTVIGKKTYFLVTR